MIKNGEVGLDVAATAGLIIDIRRLEFSIVVVLPFWFMVCSAIPSVVSVCSTI